MLTEKKIEALGVREERFSVADTSGLSLDVRPGGARSWVFRYRLNGKREKMVLGSYPVITLAAARKLRNLYAGKVAAGQSPVEDRLKARVEQAGGVLVRDFADRYIAEIVKPRTKSTANVRLYFTSAIIPELGDCALSDVTPDDIQRLVYRKRDNGRPAAAIKLHGVLKRFFEYAHDQRLIPENPVKRVNAKNLGESKPRERYLSPEELTVFLRTLDGSHQSHQFQCAFRLLLLTLVRKSELLTAEWSEIDLDGAVWQIPASKMKMSKPHTVYLSRQAVALFQRLRSLAGNSRYVLPSYTCQPFSGSSLNAALESLRTSIAHFTVHDLRRTGATMLREMGYDHAVVEKALAHEQRGISRVYIRSEFAEQRKTMLQAWGDYLDALARG